MSLQQRIASVLLLLFSATLPAVAQDSTSTDQAGTGDVLGEGFDTRKGTWLIGLSVSANTRSAENSEVLGSTFLDQSKHAFDISLEAGWLFQDYSGVGARIVYGQRRNEADVLNSGGEQQNVKEFTNSLTFAPFLRAFLPLGESRRFYIISQFELGATIEQGIEEQLGAGILSRTRTNAQEYFLGLRAGLLVFVVQNFAVEATMNVARFDYKHQKRSTDDTQDSIVNTGNLSLEFNLLALGIGFAVYF